MKCDIYRSEKKEGMYLYVAHHNDEEGASPQPFEGVPVALQHAFGKATLVMQLDIDDNRQLARVSGAQVLTSIAEKGYFIQLPPEGLINPNAVAPEGLRGA